MGVDIDYGGTRRHPDEARTWQGVRFRSAIGTWRSYERRVETKSYPQKVLMLGITSLILRLRSAMIVKKVKGSGIVLPGRLSAIGQLRIPSYRPEQGPYLLVWRTASS